MNNKLFILIITSFFFSNIAIATVKDKIINKLKTVNNFKFEFHQNINEKIEEGKCIVEYPKKIFCLYFNKNKKILVSDGKNLVIQNKITNQFYIYPIEKTPLNLILDKNFLIKKLTKSTSKLKDEKFYIFEILDGENSVYLFFDQKNFNLVGWQSLDIYQNMVVTRLQNIETNTEIKKNQFKLPKQN